MVEGGSNNLPGGRELTSTRSRPIDFRQVVSAAWYSLEEVGGGLGGEEDKREKKRLREEAIKAEKQGGGGERTTVKHKRCGKETAAERGNRRERDN